MYKLTALMAAGLATVLLAGNEARADVDGLIFDTTVSVRGEANVDGLLTFDNGTFTFATDLDVVAEGTYSVNGRGGRGPITIIRGVWTRLDTEVGVDVEFLAIVIDPKQAQGRFGERARQNNTPARITGFTSGRAQGGLSFSGEELLLVPELPQ